MYLRALEIQGFKSFPDKTVLNFGEDITAIVGPNGSGKSNISDAIRWVMGEQNSRQLRGAKMEDVIFGGTEKRSQMGFAQVTLVIDNTEHIFPGRDEAEVAVTRRYYRSGESEYYINRQSVRLKDVNELFMDTGMGREGYEKLAEVLKLRVSVGGSVLYDGLMAEMPAAVDTLLPAGSDTLDYQLTAYLDTSVGNPYMYQQLVADFYWWVADSEELAPPTGDTMQPLLWGAVVLVSGAALTVLLRRRREVSHD